jgi:predicted transcriptional regulator
LEQENKDNKKGLNIAIRDIVVVVSLLGSVLFQYFGMYQDHNNRIVKLETQRENIEKILDKIEAKLDFLVNRHLRREK